MDRRKSDNRRHNHTRIALEKRKGEDRRVNDDRRVDDIAMEIERRR